MKFGEFVEQTRLGSIMTGVSGVAEILSVAGVPGAQIVKCSARFLGGKLLESYIYRAKPWELES